MIEWKLHVESAGMRARENRYTKSECHHPRLASEKIKIIAVTILYFMIAYAHRAMISAETNVQARVLRRQVRLVVKIAIAISFNRATS